MPEPSSTEAERLVLASLRSVLADEIRAFDPAELAIVGTGPARRRSSLYFVGLDTDARCRWVVKQPNTGSRQADLRAPLPAGDQYRALTRLHSHLRRADGSSGTPRPVAYLPELEAYVMEYVPGPTLAGMIGPAAVLRPAPLLAGVARAADVLRGVHALEPAETVRLDRSALSDLDRNAARRGRQLLQQAGLPDRDRWFAPRIVADGARVHRVLLHGDFAPENVVAAPSGFYCLEPDLVERDWAEHDVVRFLLMLCDAPFFVAAVDVPAVQRLRRATAATFLESYYGAGSSSPVLQPVLQPLMLLGVAARWSTRHTDIARRKPALGRARRVLLARYFSRLLDEVGAPGWPRSATA